MKKIHMLTAAAVFHLLSLVFMVIWSALPLIFGQQIEVMVEPVDPRSLFRGNYVILSYPFSRITEKDFIESPDILKKQIKKGTYVYIRLVKKDDLYVLDKASLKPFPKKDITMLKGRVKRFWTYEESGFNCDVHYGIEAYFTQKERALKWENAVRSHVTSVKIMVLPDGRSGIKELRLNERKDSL